MRDLFRDMFMGEFEDSTEELICCAAFWRAKTKPLLILLKITVTCYLVYTIIDGQLDINELIGGQEINESSADKLELFRNKLINHMILENTSLKLVMVMMSFLIYLVVIINEELVTCGIVSGIMFGEYLSQMVFSDRIIYWSIMPFFSLFCWLTPLFMVELANRRVTTLIHKNSIYIV